MTGRPAGGLVGVLRRPRARVVWFVGLWVAVFALKAVGEFYPFSHFPMYSSFGDVAFVLRVETADGEIVPLRTVFGSKENRCKKIWKSKLAEIANARGRDSSEATADELREAGEYLFDKLMAERFYGRLEPYGPTELRLVLKDIWMAEGDRLEESERVIATRRFEPEG